MQTVSRVLHAPALDPERFQAFKAETVAYLTTFIDDLGTLTTAICVKLADWDALPGQQVTSALRRAGAASGQRDLERPDLDYWAWFTFTVQWAKHGGPLGKLTRREHAALSGGEKAVTLHLPLFAAAAAYYHAASVACPRVIVLDEMFAGVDDELRGQLFELIVNFDLDLLATSERETGTHAELDGISVYQLVAYAGASWILALRSMWDGERLLRSFEEELLNDPDDDQDLPADRDDILPMTT